MLLSQEILDVVGRGVAQGFAYGFGARMLNWIVSGWKSGGGEKSQISQSVIRRIEITDLAEGIPEGYRLCCRDDESFWELPIDEIPESIEADQSLWLIPDGEILLTASSDESGEDYDVAVSLDPEKGLGDLIDEYGDEIDAAVLGTLIASSLFTAMKVIGKKSSSQDPENIEECLTAANSELSAQGIQCKSIRPKGTSVEVDPSDASDGEGNVSGDASGSADLESLVSVISEVNSPADWESKIVDSLTQMQIPLDLTARQELERLQNEVLKKQRSPTQSVTRLAQLTADSFERAGISTNELSRWRQSALRLEDDFSDLEEQEQLNSISSSAVVNEKRPGTFWVWSRPEVDRRLLRYLKRVTSHCRLGCEQGLQRNQSLPLLRQLKQLEEHLILLDELLKTTPSLTAVIPSRRINGQVTKSLVRQLESAVRFGESLNKKMDLLLSQPEYNSDWQKVNSECLREIDKLTQHVRDRRNLHGA